MDNFLSSSNQWLLIPVIYLLLAAGIKSRKRRKWLGLLLVFGGLSLVFLASSWLHEVQILSLAFDAALIGWILFLQRNEYCRTQSSVPNHSLGRPPLSNLAPGFPEDPLMLQVLQLLHEEVGLTRRESLGLDTAINVDLSCKEREVRRFMYVLQNTFSLNFADYKARRYFHPPLLEVFFKYGLMKRGNKIPLTLGMLHQAVSMGRWDTRRLENL